MVLKKKSRAFRDAGRGIKIAWLEEFNFRFDAVYAVVMLCFSWYFGLSKMELLIVIFMIGFVLTAETFNTALEELCDKFQPEHDPHIGKIKDLAAAAVLISSCTAFVTGVIVFLPYVMELV